MIMDEPSAALTNSELEYLFEIVKTLKQEGMAILYISHRMEEIFQLCDKVSVFRDGHYIKNNGCKGHHTGRTDPADGKPGIK